MHMHTHAHTHRILNIESITYFSSFVINLVNRFLMDKDRCATKKILNSALSLSKKNNDKVYPKNDILKSKWSYWENVLTTPANRYNG